MRSLTVKTATAVLLFAAVAIQGCSRRTENQGGRSEPFGTYRRAVSAADSLAAKALRRSAAMDSAAAGER